MTNNSNGSRICSGFKSQIALWVGIFTIFTGVISSVTYINTVNEDKILNRPYLAINTTGLDALRTGQVKSNLEDLSEQLIEKQLKFSIQNTGQSPAAFRIDLSGLEEVGVTDIIPQENSNGVIFPGESKEIHYLLEIHSSFPVSELEKKEMKEYLKKEKEIIEGRREYLSRIAVVYDYLDRKDRGTYRTYIDQKMPKTGFRESDVGRIDGYSYVWVVSFDSD